MDRYYDRYYRLLNGDGSLRGEIWHSEWGWFARTHNLTFPCVSRLDAIDVVRRLGGPVEGSN